MVKKIRLLHMITGLGRGGAEAVLYQLLKRLDSHDFEHTVIYFYPGPYVEKIQGLGVETYHVAGFLTIYDPVFIYRLGKLIQKINPDCIHTLLWSANFLGRLFASWYNIPHIEVVHNNIDQNGFIRNFLDRLSSKKQGKVIAVSQGVAESLHKYAPWFIGPKIEVIKNGIAVEAHPDLALVTKEQLGLSETHFVIGAVGRFEWVKNYSLLLTAFALLYDQHSKARLVLIGSGSQEQSLRQRAYDLGIEDRVIFVVGKDARRYYAAFDCFVMSSYKEGISMALLEAMANEVAPIVIAVDKKHDVIMHEQNGLLVFKNDAQELADTIERLLQSRAFRRQLGQQAKITVQEQFKVDVMVEKYNSLYQKTVLNK